MVIYRTKYNRYVDENNSEVSQEVLENYLQNNGTILETDYNLSEDLIPELEIRIKNAFTYLRRRALASSINKTGDWDYILEQSEQYKLKYKVAKGEVVNEIINNLIADEAVDFQITTSEMKSMIIQMYEQGENIYYKFISMIERARTKALTCLETNQISKATTIIEMMENVPLQFTMQDAENMCQQLLLINVNENEEE